MPVLDHDVHPSTVVGADHRYGCWNRPDRFAKSYWAPERRWFPDGSFEQISVRIPHTMSHECRFDGGLGSDDPACEGCRHFKASEYVQKIIEAGK